MQITESANIRFRIKWTEEGKNSSKYCFCYLERKRDKDKLWDRIKTNNGDFKYDTYSILREQVNFYSNLFESAGWDEDDAQYLTDFIVHRLDNKERDVLDSDITSVDIHGAFKSMKQNKSPGQDGSIAEI